MNVHTNTSNITLETATMVFGIVRTAVVAATAVVGGAVLLETMPSGLLRSRTVVLSTQHNSTQLPNITFDGPSLLRLLLPGPWLAASRSSGARCKSRVRHYQLPRHVSNPKTQHILPALPPSLRCHTHATGIPPQHTQLRHEGEVTFDVYRSHKASLNGKPTPAQAVSQLVAGVFTSPVMQVCKSNQCHPLCSVAEYSHRKFQSNN